ncbi:MAG: hypothetical protein Ct9H90mP25_1610 [Gammaproteobacteria bacterium]|nr:MAG: hypothetical protein Ct9H90mP25_1610 [Gammaproteobacteria bacterium]
MMACTLDGELVGSISGGCVEEDFLEELREGKLKALYQSQAKPITVIYGEKEAEQGPLEIAFWWAAACFVGISGTFS